LLGADVTGPRFPFLIKLLDPAKWLSAQVHPDDADARRLEGPAATGKTEAWHILDAAPDAELILGMNGTRAQLEEGIATPKMAALLKRRRVLSGDTFLVPARTMHAIGPGLFLYEIQQPQGVTYRAYDWDSPRELHVEKTLAVVEVGASGEHRPLPQGGEGLLVETDYFRVERRAGTAPTTLDPAGRSVHAVTALETAITLSGDGFHLTLAAYETAVLPAGAGPVGLEGAVRGQPWAVLDASVPQGKNLRRSP
jgi:mannose-6-phosphate isomerase